MFAHYVKDSGKPLSLSGNVPLQVMGAAVCIRGSYIGPHFGRESVIFKLKLCEQGRFAVQLRFDLA